MTSTLFALLILVAIVLFWLDGARSRELAVAVAAELCRRRSYQLLDETVALARLGIARSSQGLRLRRMFRFDYSQEGVGRRTGWIIMRGSEVENVDLDDADRDSEPPAGPPDQRAGGDGNIVPFRRRN